MRWLILLFGLVSMLFSQEAQLDSLKLKFFQLTNEIRQTNDSLSVANFVYDSALSEIAQVYAEELANGTPLGKHLGIEYRVEKIRQLDRGQFMGIGENETRCSILLENPAFAVLYGDTNIVCDTIRDGNHITIVQKEISVSGLVKSSGNYSNIINPDFSCIGIGVARNSDNYYFVQLFVGWEKK